MRTIEVSNEKILFTGYIVVQTAASIIMYILACFLRNSVPIILQGLLIGTLLIQIVMIFLEGKKKSEPNQEQPMKIEDAGEKKEELIDETEEPKEDE